MRMAGLLVALGATLTILTAPSARAADECRGLQVCIPVSGPWVTIPASTAADGAPSRSWYVKCPKGSIVGGVDARLTSRAIEMSFSGRLGSPVNPGVTTTSEVVFTGTYSGQKSRPAAFRPFVGCIPTAGGGRVPTVTAAPAAFKPTSPTQLRVRTVSFTRRIERVTNRCPAGERLVSFTHAVAFSSPKEPTARQLAGVRSSLVRRGHLLVAGADLGGAARSLKAKLQVLAVCTRGALQP